MRSLVAVAELSHFGPYSNQKNLHSEANKQSKVLVRSARTFAAAAAKGDVGVTVLSSTESKSRDALVGKCSEMRELVRV